MLDNHPIFDLVEIGASSRSAGKSYKEATTWKLSQPCPAKFESLPLTECSVEHFPKSKIVFSGLDASVAGEIETAFASAHYHVFSNAKNHRMNPITPLCVPLVNADHMEAVRVQREKNSTRGFIVTNANCSTTALVVPLKALQDAFGPISRVFCTTLQAISGAGYPGVASLDIFDNVVPYISGEEEKIESETRKILGSFCDGKFKPIECLVSATCNRVPVLDGHTECVSVEFERKPAPSVDEVIKALEAYRCEGQELGVFSAPEKAIIVREASDRPQPRLDRDACAGMSVVVGRVRACPIFNVKFTLLAHNTVLGAAGSSIMNAEIAVKKGLIE